MIESTELTNQESGYPLMTSSRQGLFVQNEYFNREKQSSEDTLFSVVPRGYVTYRHMSDDDIFHFNINNLAVYGLVSREYPVFTTTPNLNSYLLVEILNSSFERETTRLLEISFGYSIRSQFRSGMALSL